MATNKRAFSAQYRVVMMVSVPVVGTTIEEALESAKAIKLAEIAKVDTGNSLDDYEHELTGVSADRWL